MPHPNPNETREDFLDRGMGDPEAVRDFPDEADRFAFLVSQWDQDRIDKLVLGIPDRGMAVEKILSRKTQDQIMARYGVGDKKTLYVHRKLLNGKALARWAKEQGFQTTMPAEEMHATVAYSKEPVLWGKFQADKGPLLIHPGAGRDLKPLGADGAIVLGFRSSALEGRHEEFKAGGATWDHQGYQPHVTVTYHGQGVDLAKVKPFDDDLIFGPEVFGEVEDGWSDKIVEKIDTMQLGIRVTKSQQDQRLIWGWFSVIEIDGKRVVDLQGDMISEEELVKTAHNFIRRYRTAKMMHRGRAIGDVVESVVFTRDVQKALGIDLGKVGWFGCMKVENRDVWEKAKNGELRGFSPGGYANRTEVA